MFIWLILETLFLKKYDIYFITFFEIRIIKSGMKLKYIYVWVNMTKQPIADLYSRLIDEKVWVRKVAIRG